MTDAIQFGLELLAVTTGLNLLGVVEGLLLAHWLITRKRK
jgi:hypothetical protein